VRLGVTSIVAAFGLTALTQIFALVGFSGFGVAPQFAGILDSLMPQLVSVYLLGFALVETRRGANQDLLEPRRQLRTWLVAFMVGYGVLVLLFEVALRGAPPPWQLELVHQSLLAGLIGVALYFVQRHGVLLLDPHRLPAVVTPAELNVAADRESVPHAALEGPGNDRSGVVDPSQNEALLQSRLAQWELAGGFLEPGLTIASLASRLGTQEYLLRRLLNGRLGFRNFNDFLHRLRIAEACRRLRGPDASALPILTLSIELGYSSLATFNRAFKSIVGVSPTEYRNTPQFRN
jgi:AraC-like DNA-binding protein